MSLPPDYANEISALDREILKHQPNDILQFCANFFNRRLESQRTEYLLSHSNQQGRGTAENSFPGNNPFSTSPSGSGFAKTQMHRLEEEEENDTMTSPTASSFAAVDFSKPRSNNHDSGEGAFGNFGGFGGSSKNNITQMPPLTGEGQAFPTNYNTNRRTSVAQPRLQ
jgi:cAMP-dependent protein kinase regulator